MHVCCINEKRCVLLSSKFDKKYFSMVEQKTKQVKLKTELRKLAYSEKVVPVLHISGVWLEEIGFRAGGQVMITIEQNQLIIKPA